MAPFPRPRTVRGWSLQFEYAWLPFFLAIEGRFGTGNWIRIFESAQTGPVNYGHLGAVTTPMLCSAVRILTDCPYLIRSCQFFDSAPLVPATMSSNSVAGVQLLSEPENYYLYRCFTEQSNAFTHGTVDWYYNNSDWQSNRGMPSTRILNRFAIRFAETKMASGFSVGGLTDYHAEYCYANCFLIVGRESDTDFWRPLGEIEFEPSERRT
jgi:hypothetical protein